MKEYKYEWCRCTHVFEVCVLQLSGEFRALVALTPAKRRRRLLVTRLSHRAGLDTALPKRKSSLCWDSNPGYSETDNHFTWWVTLTHQTPLNLNDLINRVFVIVSKLIIKLTRYITLRSYTIRRKNNLFLYFYLSNTSNYLLVLNLPLNFYIK